MLLFYVLQVWVYDLGVSLDECQELMWEYYNPRCEPEWTNKRDFNRTIHNAYRYAKNTAGCRTAVGEFQAAIDSGQIKPVAEPPEGWEANAKRAESKTTEEFTPVSVPLTETANENLSEIQAATLRAEITAKSAVWDLARCFVANKYTNRGLIRSEEVFYAYDGKCWEIVDDKIMRSAIAWYYQEFKFAPSKIKNILTSVEDFVQKSRSIKNNQWLHGDHDSNCTMVFNNGIAILEDERVNNIPHTSDYFTLNSVKYDYVEKSECQEWLKFLGSLWEDPRMIERLQEWFGYSLTSGNKYQSFALMVGKPRAGKGVITTVLSKMLGQHNTVSPPLTGLDNDSNIIGMSNSNLILIPEANTVHPSKRDSVLATLKSITGNDPITAHRLYKGAMSCDQFGNVVMTSNDMPEFVDNSGALAARMVCFPFTRSFVGREDRDLPQRLESELSGILNWAIEGLKRLKSKTVVNLHLLMTVQKCLKMLSVICSHLQISLMNFVSLKVMLKLLALNYMMLMFTTAH